MTAVSRWVQFPITASTSFGDGDSANYEGRNRGALQGDTCAADTVTLPSDSRLKMSLDGGTGYEIVLLSGTLDPRIIAQDITYKMHTIASGTAWSFAQCDYVNNTFKVWSGTIDSGSSVSMQSASGNDAQDALCLSSGTTTISGSSGGNSGPTNMTVSGTYNGQFDDVVTVVCSTYETIGIDDFTTPTAAGVATLGGAGVYTGTTTLGGMWNESTDDTYVITIDCTNGLVMGQGQGNVPSFTVTSTNGDNDSTPRELLYPDHWYEVGQNGVLIKFSDAPFGDGDTFTIKCRAVTAGGGIPGAAYIIWGSRKGNYNSLDASHTGVLTSIGGNVIEASDGGDIGLQVYFTVGAALAAGDEWNIVCRGPQPVSYSTSTTTLNFGNVTVSTDSAVKAVWFELLSGAVLMTTCKFGLQSHGTFQHHDQGNSDTEFRFGTIGAGQRKYTGTWNGEWKDDMTAANLISGDYTYSNSSDLAVVDSADNSENIGRYSTGLISDFIYLCLKIGSAETGANSGISYRLYFDYS